MKSETILQSNFLDILFDNRNKEYGAYVLRKQYSHRLTKGVFTMLAVAGMFAIWQGFIKPVVHVERIFDIAGPSVITSVPPPVTPVHPQTHTSVTTRQNINNSVFPPQIVNTDFKKADPVIEPVSSVQTAGPEGPPSDKPAITGISGDGSDKKKDPLPEVKPAIDRNNPLAEAEVMPQFPGGMSQLLKFLKNNLHAPDNANEEEIQVKVKFVVNYDGTLRSFEVIQSGGSEYDNEVIRVLKKMPVWVPGKSSNQAVSVWYTVPVKFSYQQ